MNNFIQDLEVASIDASVNVTECTVLRCCALTRHQMSVRESLQFSGSSKNYGSLLTVLIGVNCVPVRTVSE